MDAIEGFQGEYRFLSNFFVLPEPIVEMYEDPDAGTMIPVQFPTVEHAYQASKYLTLDRIIDVAICTSPFYAKCQGRRYVARSDWDHIKLDIMLYFVRKKFAQPAMKDALLKTGTAELYEVNSHGDMYWGCNDFLEGENHLGLILMQVRQEIQDQI
jgi:ribA/ribD-fused uncharacterized protein